MVQHGLFSTESEVKNEILEDGFVEFWNDWPRHKRKYNKKGCLQLWRARKLHKIQYEILRALHAQKKSADWLKERGEYIPAPKVWLNQERWEAGQDQQEQEPTVVAQSPLARATSGY